ncbi:response regulator receiver domain-containing protein [Pseudoduganella lurida]|uniref:histidine kinase n=1 Tax=Pseudoduganella lurida TaxID=1036180 RepID=A0A562RJR1_9BURK|nr:ATP-binding protein [Pseudoduganella lurida]TWI69278.1 response regulator receiver domain-containing protein [Pseudoduganella lurida]
MASELHQSVVVFAPLEGDGAALRGIIEDERERANLCTDADGFYKALDDSALAVIVTEEGLAKCSLQDLSAALNRQRVWSDVPILVLAAADRREIDSERFDRLAGVGNVILLTRPMSRLVLAMAIRSALRTRRLQFAVRDQLEELAGHADRLESTVAERTRMLEHEVSERRRAEHALAEARRLESLGQLTGGIAHDFNNMLQVVAGSETLLRLVLTSSPDTRVTRALDGIRRATSHGASLTQQLLAYARRQPLSSIALDIRAHLHATSEMILRTLSAEIELRQEVDPFVWSVLVDPAQLDAAVLNIVGNARDAMPNGGILTLHARNWRLPDVALPEGGYLHGEFVSLSVTDNGEGMTEETARQAFEPFFTTKAVGKGTGLGLSQVYGFAIQSGGLAFLRRESVGTTVGMLLPRSLEKVAAPDIQHGFNNDGLAGVRVLYVEDDANVAESTVAILRAIGAQVKWVISADDAITADFSEIEIVCSDVIMPGQMDGIELARWIAANHPHMPVVLTSGYMLSPERLRELDVHFVRKPFTIATIEEAFTKALHKSRSGR